jgi:hypothetical protein
VANATFFDIPPVFDFFPEEEFCLNDKSRLNVLKTDTRIKKTIQIGSFKARETIKACPQCGIQYRSKELSKIVPSACNFGYDILVHVGKALFVNHLADYSIVEQLAVKNVHISPSEIAYLGKKFIVYLMLAHRRSAPRIKVAMALKGGYILHLDATYEDKSPLLMSGLDSIMKIVLGKSDSIVPFLEDIKSLFGEPLALVHDMSKGIIKAVEKVFPDSLDFICHFHFLRDKAVEKVFPDSLDFICHFHFLRDIGKDLLEAEYDNIRKSLTKHGIGGKLNYRLRKFKQTVDENTNLIDMLNHQKSFSSDVFFICMPVIAAYSLITWALNGKKQGNGYGFPFDRPHLELRKIKLRRGHRDNKPLHKAFFDLSDVMKDRSLWKSVDRIESEIEIFEKLREAMRIAPKTSKRGLNTEGATARIGTIEKEVKKFRKEIVSSKTYKFENLQNK